MNILVLEDSPERIEIFNSYFSNLYPDCKVIYVSTYIDFCSHFETGNFQLLFLDHDLGVYTDEVRDGSVVARYLAEKSAIEGVIIPPIIIHSHNPDGAKNIKGWLVGHNITHQPFALVGVPQNGLLAASTG